MLCRYVCYDIAAGAEVAALLQDLHRFFRCIAYIEEAAQLVVVGDDGQAGHAHTSQQLAASLSVSVWNVSNPSRVTLATFAGIKQVCPSSALLFLSIRISEARCSCCSLASLALQHARSSKLCCPACKVMGSR